MHENVDEKSEDTDFCPIASRESIIFERENNVARGIRKATWTNLRSAGLFSRFWAPNDR